MLGCVKRKSSRIDRERSESPRRTRPILLKRRAQSGSTEDLTCQGRPDRSLILKKSATLAGHTTQHESISRSSSKSKTSTVFKFPHWRTVSVGSLFSPRRKRDESGMATSSGFVSPSEQLASTSESSKRPKTVHIRSSSNIQLTSDDTGQTTPVGPLGHEDGEDPLLDYQDEHLSQMTRLALQEKMDSEARTPKGERWHKNGFDHGVNGCSGGDDEEDVPTPKARRESEITTVANVEPIAKKVQVAAKEQHGKKGTSGNSSFFRAARVGNVQRITELLNAGVDVDARNSSDLTALHMATKEGHLETVRVLVDHGASLDLTTQKGNTALHIASLAGHKEIVQVLLDHGADVNCQSQNGFTPLYMAAQEDHVDVIQQLLDHSANPALATEDGFTPLAVALQQGNQRSVALLVERDTRGKTKLPALHIAAKKNDVQAVKLLLGGSEEQVDHASASGFTPLHIAAHYGSANVANLLIKRGANINYKAKNAITPLHVAAKWGRDNVIQELIKAGATVDARTKDGLSPLHCAARSGSTTALQLLLKAGAQTSLKTKNDLTPLHMAAQGDHEGAAKLLLCSGADADAVSVECLTPLHVTAHCGNLNVAKTLLKAKCNVNARALNGFTPLHVACKKAKADLIELLIKHGANLEAITETGLAPLHVAVFVGSPEATAILVKRGANVNRLTLRKESALHLVARNGKVDVAKILIKNGIDLNAQTQDGQTPLHIAVRSRQPGIVKLLLDSGADPNVNTQENYTALHLAAKENSDEFVQCLLKHKANVELKTKKGYTALHLVAKHGNLQIAKTLLQQAKMDPNRAARSGFTPVHVAAFYNRPSVLALLLDNGGNPTKTLKNGFTPLHLAAKRGNAQCASVLCEAHAPVNAQSKSGYTPLHLAAQIGATEIAETLIGKYKAQPELCATDGLTPLHVAIQEDKVPTAECLVNSGACLDCATKEARFTPLHIAAFRGHLGSLRFILSRMPEDQWPFAVNNRTKMGSTSLHLAAQQGHVQMVLKLLQCGADPNARNMRGWTAAQLAYKQHYTDVFKTLRKVTTNVTDWSQPSLTGAGPDGLSDGDPQLVTGSLTFDRLERMNDHVFGDSDEEDSADLMSTPAFLRRPPASAKSLTNGDDDFLRTASYDLLYQQIQYMRSRVGESDDASIPATPKTDRQMLINHSQELLQCAEVNGAPNLTELSTHSTLNGHVIKPVTDNQLVSMHQTTLSQLIPDNSIRTEWDFYPGNLHITRKPIKAGFLVSFVVDARGCLVEAKRRSDMRFYIPPNASSAPVRIICRVLRPEYSPPCPGLNDGEHLAARMIELSPPQLQFDSPVMLELPHLAWLTQGERELVVVRSETGSTWKEHSLDATDQAVKEALGGIFERLESIRDLSSRRIHRILTYDFPQYFALLGRFRQEYALIGAEGGVLASTVEPRVQAVFPPGSLQKRIRIGLQVHRIPQNIINRIAGGGVASSPVVSIEPRRRKFHKAITLNIPFAQRSKRSTRFPKSRDEKPVCVLRSLSGGTNPALWEDITGTTVVTWTGDCASLSTTLSARFWLIEGLDTGNLIETASMIYHDSIAPPIVGRFAVFARQPMNLEQATELVATNGSPTKTPEANLVQLRCLCLTDDSEDKTLECLERFSLLAVGPSTQVFENHTYWVEVTGALVPITSGNTQPKLVVHPFRENRVTFPVRVRAPEQRSPGESLISGTIAFLHDPRSGADHPADCHEAVTTLEVSLPRPGRSVLVATTETEILGRSELDRSMLARQLSSDWKRLAPHLGFGPEGVETISRTSGTEQEHADLLLRMWQQKASRDHDITTDEALGNRLADALREINREDVIHPSMIRVGPVVTQEELAVASNVLYRHARISDLTAVQQPTPAVPATISVEHRQSKLSEHILLQQQKPGEVATVPAEDRRTKLADVTEPREQTPEETAAIPAEDQRSKLAEVVTPQQQVPEKVDLIQMEDRQLEPSDLIAFQQQTPEEISSVRVEEVVVTPDSSTWDRLLTTDTHQPGESLIEKDQPDSKTVEQWPTEKPEPELVEPLEPMREILDDDTLEVEEFESLDERPASGMTERSFEDVMTPPTYTSVGMTPREEPLDKQDTATNDRIESTPASPVITPKVAPTEPETGVPQLLRGQIEDEVPTPSPKETTLPEGPIIETVQPTQVRTEETEPWDGRKTDLPHLELTSQPELEASPITSESPEVLTPQTMVDKQLDATVLAESLAPEMEVGRLTPAFDSDLETPERYKTPELMDAWVIVDEKVEEERGAPTEVHEQVPSTEQQDQRQPEAVRDENEQGFEDLYQEAARDAETDEPFYDFEDEPFEHVSYPSGSAGHDVIQSSPEGSRTLENIEEYLSDGTVLKTRLATEETVQSVTCRDWEEGVNAAVESGAYVIEEPDERTEVEEVEETLPDGTVITRLITTKYIVDRVTERAVSEEQIGVFEEPASEQVPAKQLEIRLLW